MKMFVLLTLFLAVGSQASFPNPLSTLGYKDAGNKDVCALVVNGPGKSSLFDHTRGVLFGSRQYQGPETCITYEAVNRALALALQHLSIETPDQEWMPEQLATVGEVFLEVTRILAKQYGLTAYDVENKLPLLDTYHTDLLRYCPDYLAPLQCIPGRYRRFDGLCNNLEHPTWGARLTVFSRFLPPAYHDGISEPRIGFGGYELPSPRIVTSTVHFEEGYDDHAATTLLISWGQFMDHDFTLTGTMLDPLNRNEFEECCRPRGAPNKYCLNIDIPANDVFFSRFGVRCIDFVRGFPGVRHGCRLGSRAQFNLLTATIDANTVYGVRESFARSLRSGYGGQLRMNPHLSQYGLQDLLPAKTDIPDEGCTRHNNNQLCFDAGEIRVNEQLILACMHTLWAREHNKIAQQLASINPHWDDEILYQEARHIVIAMIQHITFNEFLPVLLGKDVISKFGLLLQKEGYWNGYDPNVNPGISASFAAAAFRFGHSLLPTNVERWSKGHKYITHTALSDLIRQPFDLYEPGGIDEYFLGMTNQPALAMDDFVTEEVTTLLFKKPGAEHGVDLAAFNLQRNREFGLPGYTAFRKFCGLPPVETWEDLLGSMHNETVRRYASVLKSPHDIDLWSGGVAERALPGSLLGPTFSCVIATQFSAVRTGDRFWYENSGEPSSFNPDQLEEIRKARLARVLCENTDLIETIQLYPMVMPDHEINPRVNCKSSIIPYMDLSKWADYQGAYTSKAPTLVQPLPYGHSPNTGSPDRNGIHLNEHALNQLRAALNGGIYSGQFSPPHRQPLLPNYQSGKIKPQPTRRPVVLSQEYIDILDSRLRQAGYPGLNSLYNILSHPPNSLYKRSSNHTEFFGTYEPYTPKKVAEYRHDMDEVMDTVVHGPMNFTDRFEVRKFVPIQGPYGNFSLQEFMHLAEYLINNVDTDPSSGAYGSLEGFGGDSSKVGTAKARIASTGTSVESGQPKVATAARKSDDGWESRRVAPMKKQAGRKTAKTKRDTNPTNKQQHKKQKPYVVKTESVPLDLSGYYKPSKLDIVLSKDIVDQVESSASDKTESIFPAPVETKEELMASEGRRAAAHTLLQEDIDKALNAMKSLEESYRLLYDELDKARKLFPVTDPVRKNLDDLLASAVLPSSIQMDNIKSSTGNNVTSRDPTPR